MNTISLKLKKAPTKKKTIQNQMVKGQKKEVNDEDDDDEVEVIEDKQNKKEESGCKQQLPRLKETSPTAVGLTGETLKGEVKQNTLPNKCNEEHDVKKKKLIREEAKNVNIITTEHNDLEEEEKKETGITDGTSERSEITDYMKNKQDVLKTCRRKNLQEEQQNNVPRKEKSPNILTKTKQQSKECIDPVEKNENEQIEDIKNQDIGLNLLAEAAAKVSEEKDQKKTSVDEKKKNSKKGKGKKSNLKVHTNPTSSQITVKSVTQGKDKETTTNKHTSQDRNTKHNFTKTQSEEQVKLSDVTKENEDEVFQDETPKRIEKNGRRCKSSGPTKKHSHSAVKTEENTKMRKNQKQNSSKIEGKEQSTDIATIEKKKTSPLMGSTSLRETSSLISEASKSTDMANYDQSIVNAQNKKGKEDVATPPFEMYKKGTKSTISRIHNASTTGTITMITTVMMFSNTDSVILLMEETLRQLRFGMRQIGLIQQNVLLQIKGNIHSLR